MRAICSASSDYVLGTLLQRHQHQLNFLHVSAALCRLAHLGSDAQQQQQQQQQQQTASSPLGDPPDPELGQGATSSSSSFTFLLSLSHAMVHQLRPRELSSILWAVAKLGAYPGKAWLEDFVHAAHQQMPAFNARDIGITIWAMARFQFHPGHAWMSAFLHQAQAQLHHLDAQALTNLLWGLASLDYHPPDPWLDQWKQAAGRQLRHLTPQAHANAVWALARMQRAPGPTWEAKLHHLLLADAPAFSGKDLSMLLFALGSSSCCSTSEHSSSSSSSSGSIGVGQAALAAAASAASHQLGSLSCSDTACMLWGLAQLGHLPGPSILQRVFAHTQPRLQSADPKILAILAFTLERLQALRQRQQQRQQQGQQRQRGSRQQQGPLAQPARDWEGPSPWMPVSTGMSGGSGSRPDSPSSANHQVSGQQHADSMPPGSGPPYLKCLAPTSWLASFLAATYVRLLAADPYSCAMMGHSLAQLGVCPSPK